MSEATKKRRFVRYSLRTLLVLPMLFAAAWWWLTWPERTAQRFVRLLNDDPNAAKAMVDGRPKPSLGFWKIATSPQCSFVLPTITSASWADCVAARRPFEVGWQIQDSEGDLGPFIAVRNRVMLSPTASDKAYLILYKVTKSRATSLAEQLRQYYPGEERIKAAPEMDAVLVGMPQRVHGELRPLLLILENESP
jgi:hypothetical protein